LPPIISADDRMNWFFGYKFHTGCAPFARIDKDKPLNNFVFDRKGWNVFQYDTACAIYIPEKAWDHVLPIGVVLPGGRLQDLPCLETVVTSTTVGAMLGINCDPNSVEFQEIALAMGKMITKKRGCMIFSSFDLAVQHGCQTIFCVPYKEKMVECGEHVVNDEGSVVAMASELMALSTQMLA